MATKKRSTLLDTKPASPSTSDLRALFNGRVIAPDDPRYESARTVFYGGIDSHPSAIIRVVDAGDETEELVAISKKSQVIRCAVKEIPVLGRQTQGVRIMRLREGDSLASAVCL